MNDFLVRGRLSIWLLLIALIISAVMMRPSGASIFALGAEALVLLGMRTVAKLEGRAER